MFQLFFFILYTLLATLAFLVCKIILYTIRYKWYTSKLDPRIPRMKSLFPIFYYFDTNGAFTQLMEEIKDKDGNFYPIISQGPQYDGVPFLAVTDVNIFKQVFNNIDKFPKNPLTYEVLSKDFGLGNGLVTSAGALWKSERKRITPLFHFGILKTAVPTVVEATKQFIADVLDPAAFSSKELEGSHLFSELTNHVIIKFAFGSDFDYKWMVAKWEALNKAFESHVLVKVIFGDFVDYIPLPTTVNKNLILRSIRQKVKEVIKRKKAENRSETEPSNLISLLIHSSEPIADSLVVDECLTFLFAGTDTTSKLLSWTVYFLGLHPDVQKKLQIEVDTVLERRDPAYEDLPKLQYCKCVLLEALRIRPPGGALDKLVAEDSVLGGYKVPKGVCITLLALASQTDNRLFPNANDFIPERWEKSSGGDSENLVTNPFSYVPFSAGERNCIGQKFALQEATTALSMIVQRFTIVINREKPVYMAFVPLLTPMGLAVCFEKRNQ